MKCPSLPAWRFQSVVRAGGLRRNMADRKSFLLRIDSRVLDAVRGWADDELRSLNGQIEFVLREAVLKEGRMKKTDKEGDGASESTEEK